MSFGGELTLKGLKLNQLVLAPDLKGKLVVSNGSLTVQAKGGQDDSLFLDARSRAVEDVLTLGSMMPAMAGYRKGRLSLKQGPMKIDLNLAERGLQLTLESLNLGALEVASLHGLVDEADIELDVGALEGRGSVRMTNPKFSGVVGSSLDGSCRWENDTVRVERFMLQQQNSTYQMNGEYTFPSKFSELSSALQHAFQGPAYYVDAASRRIPPQITSALVMDSISKGRWRINLVLPKADVEEMLPAASAWASAGAEQTWGEYS